MFPVRYAKSGDLNIAYQLFGQGERYLILIPGWVSNVEECWGLPGFSEFMLSLGNVCRVVLFDKRGTGLSDRVDEQDLPSLDHRIEDVRSIMDKEGIDRAVIMGVSEGGPMAILFAVNFPERVSSLIIHGSYACWIRSAGNPYGLTLAAHQNAMDMIEDNWATGFGLRAFAPNWFDNSSLEASWASFLRKSASPNTAKALYRMNIRIDVRRILSEVTQDTLVIHKSHDRVIHKELGKYISRHIPNAEWMEVDGSDHLFWIDHNGLVRKKITTFLGYESAAEPRPIGTLVLLPEMFTGPDSEILHREGGQCVLTFRTATRAVEYIQSQGISSHKVLIHTGPFPGQSDRSGNATLALLLDSAGHINTPGIWVSTISKQFLDSPKNSWTDRVILSCPSLNTEMGWVRLEDRSRAEVSMHYQSLHDEKLSVADIEILLRLKEYMENNYLDNPGLDELSRFSGLNNFKLKYGFKKLFNIPAKQYLKELRLGFARNLLRETELPVRQIAHRVGYFQTSSFSKAYHQKFGKSPVAERRKDSDLH